MKLCVECNPDYRLIQILTSPDNKNIIHSGNKSKVLFDLLNIYDNSIGLIDEDPNSFQPRELCYFFKLKNMPQFEIEILVDHSRTNHLVILKPRLEEWILNAAAESGINPLRDFGLPLSGPELHSVINSNLDEYEKLLKVLLGANQRLKFLASFLNFP